jgi:hypothetical protein
LAAATRGKTISSAIIRITALLAFLPDSGIRHHRDRAPAGLWPDEGVRLELKRRFHSGIGGYLVHAHQQNDLTSEPAGGNS